MIVTTEHIRQLMRDALRLRGIEGENAEFMSSDYIESELEGHKTHGISKFLTIDAGLSKNAASFSVVKQGGCFAKLDGNGGPGHIVAMNAAKLCVQMAKEHGVGIVSFSNVSRYARVTPYARLIASEGCIGILTNNGGPCCVVPFGGRQGLFGTNPLCFGFPGKEKPYVFDFATSQKVWGAVRQAIVEGKPLPENCFVDASGEYTTDPEKAEAVLPFGGPKGYTLCYALEVMTGAFIGAAMGPETHSEYDLGYLFAALSPSMFTDLDAFKAGFERLADAVRTSPAVRPDGKVYVPGEIFGSTPASARQNDAIDLADDVYARLKEMSVSLSGGYKNSKAMN